MAKERIHVALKSLAPKSLAKSVKSFKAAHDRDIIVPGKITAALAAMASKNPEDWEYEADFIRLAGIGQTDAGKYREMFIEHVVMAAQEHGSKRSPRRAWFATVKAAKAARGE